MQTYLLPATARAAGTAGPALGGRRRDALGAQVQRDDAVGFERVGKESGHEAAARRFSLSLLDHLQRVLVCQRRQRGIAKGEGIGQRLHELGLGRPLPFVQRALAWIRHTPKRGARAELVVGLMAEPLAERANFSDRHELETVIT